MNRQASAAKHAVNADAPKPAFLPIQYVVIVAISSMLKHTLSLIGSSTLALTSLCLADVPRPNVLFIAVDDLNDWVGHLGNNQIITPNMDALAAQGSVFTSAYCQYPVCGPSRASVMSGMYFHALNIDSIQMKDDAVVEAARKLGSSLIHEYFAQHGYKTMAVGKVLHRHMPLDTVDESGGRGPWDFNEDQDGNKLRLNWHGDTGLLDWGPLINKEESEMSDYKAAEWAVEQISQKHEKPFFLMVGFMRPHTPWHIPQRYLDMYPLDKIEYPPYREDDYDNIPKAAEEVWNSYPHVSWALENDQWAKMLQAYMGCVTFVDTQIGKILDALEKSPYRDNTIIVLWSDHGFHMGEKHIFQKHTAWEQSAKVPLIIKDPRQGPTEHIDANVQLIDIYPTLVELSGLPANKVVQGRSLFPLMRNPSLEWSYPAFTFRRNTFATVKFDSFRFTEYFDNSRELYDHEEDPYEWENLAFIPENSPQDTIANMRKLFDHPDVIGGFKESKR
jgi:arylsulfatase A-like enzyme